MSETAFFLVSAVENAEGAMTPALKGRYRVIRPYRDADGCFIVEVETDGVEISGVEFLLPAKGVEWFDPRVTTHLEWWAEHPEDNPGWVTI